MNATRLPNQENRHGGPRRLRALPEFMEHLFEELCGFVWRRTLRPGTGIWFYRRFSTGNCVADLEEPSPAHSAAQTGLTGDGHLVDRRLAAVREWRPRID